ncbi:hypothetical protein ACWF0M_12455 [Kribbella sp. NPDC055110]
MSVNDPQLEQQRSKVKRFMRQRPRRTLAIIVAIAATLALITLIWPTLAGAIALFAALLAALAQVVECCRK